MKLSLQNLVAASILASLLGVGLFAYPSFAEDAGIDFWNVPEYQARIRSAENRHQEMDRQNKIVLERTYRKIEITHQLVADECTFDDAIERFQTINRTMPTGIPPAIEERGRTQREKAAYQVISYVRSLRTETATALAVELECTLKAEQ